MFRKKCQWVCLNTFIKLKIVPCGTFDLLQSFIYASPETPHMRYAFLPAAQVAQSPGFRFSTKLADRRKNIVQKLFLLDVQRNLPILQPILICDCYMMGSRTSVNYDNETMTTMYSKHSVMQLKYAFLCFIVFTALLTRVDVSFAVASTSMLNFYKQRIMQSCQCASCDLQGIDLKGFSPGSRHVDINPFARKAPGQRSSISWLSCNFSSADLSHANLVLSNFVTSIRGYISPLNAADFNGAVLQYAALSRSKFYGASFSYADLSHSNISGAMLFLTDFSNANLSYARLIATHSSMDAMHGWGSNFHGARFSHADLSRAVLYGYFRGANFSYANLQQTKLVNVMPDRPVNRKDWQQPWYGVNFHGANLTGAILETGSSGKTAILVGAYLCQTIMPDGKVSNRDCAKKLLQRMVK